LFDQSDAEVLQLEVWPHIITDNSGLPTYELTHGLGKEAIASYLNQHHAMINEPPYKLYN